jgi:hypothetical protein
MNTNAMIAEQQENYYQVRALVELVFLSPQWLTAQVLFIFDHFPRLP